jgi:hypothetical protein
VGRFRAWFPSGKQRGNFGMVARAFAPGMQASRLQQQGGEIRTLGARISS